VVRVVRRPGGRMSGDATPIPELIARKRDGGELSGDELRGLLAATSPTAWMMRRWRRC
jgi:hypothetical protein